jgi:hypothetical protein
LPDSKPAVYRASDVTPQGEIEMPASHTESPIRGTVEDLGVEENEPPLAGLGHMQSNTAELNHGHADTDFPVVEASGANAALEENIGVGEELAVEIELDEPALDPAPKEAAPEKKPEGKRKRSVPPPLPRG